MNEKLEKIITHPLTIPVVTGVVSFAAGVGGGYILSRQLISRGRTMPPMPEEEIRAMTTFDADAVEEFIKGSSGGEEPTEEPESLEEGVSVVNEEVDELQKLAEKLGREPIVAPPVEDPVPHSVFASDSPDWDYEKEIEARTEHEPYVIHKDEFYAQETEYTQETLTYFEGDNIMTDQEDIPVYDHLLVVGPLLWGHGSEDPNVFHVRNDKRRAEYEVLRHTGSYAVEIAGLDDSIVEVETELKHTSQRRFRIVDD